MLRSDFWANFRPATPDRFRALQEAYSVLSGPEWRQQCDIHHQAFRQSLQKNLQER